MAKILRKNQKIFGKNALSTQIGVFGSLAAGSPTTTTDPETIQSLSNYLGGWFNGVVGSNSPAIEDMNALHYLYAYQLAYLFQAGVPEYDANTTYYIGSVVNYNNVQYQSLTDNNLGNTPAIGVNWQYATDSTYSKATAGTNTYATSTTVQGQLNQLDTGIVNITPAGSVIAYAGSSAPTGYLMCDGTAYSRTTYANLYSAIGTAYGYGDGSTTFNVPDLRYTFIRGKGDAISVTGSGTASSSNATFTNHGIIRTGMVVRKTSGTLSPLAATTDYYAIVVDSNTLAFATTYANAMAGTKIAITGANSAVIEQYEDPDISTRLQAAVGGNTSGLGTRQDDQLQSHTHTIPLATDDAAGSRCADGSVGGATTTSGSTGGNETRPKNIYMNYIIKT